MKRLTSHQFDREHLRRCKESSPEQKLDWLAAGVEFAQECKKHCGVPRLHEREIKGMKLVYLYGPPAVGKLTVARELSKLTGFRVFHNHLTLDVVKTCFPWGTKAFSTFLTKWRLELLEAAAQEGISGLIFTYMYTGSLYEHSFIARVLGTVQGAGGEVCFVQLRCTPAALRKRVKEPSRKAFGKITTQRTLMAMVRERDLFRSIPLRKILTIDNTRVSPKAAARRIREWYGF